MENTSKLVKDFQIKTIIHILTPNMDENQRDYLNGDYEM